jgi:hypothetical protein
MASIIKIAFIATLLSLCSCCQNKQTLTESESRAIEKKINEIYAEITKAAESVDAEKLFGYVSETNKGSLIQGGKIVLTRQEALDSYKKNSRGIKKVDYKIDRQYVTVISPETALLVAEGGYEATTTEGKIFGSPFAQTVIFVLRNKEWKVFHSHTSSPVGRQ